MRQHYNLDRLVDYSTEEIFDTTKVVNPQYRELDGEIRKTVGRLNRKRNEFGAIVLNLNPAITWHSPVNTGT